MIDKLLAEAATLSARPLPEANPTGEWCFYIPDIVLENWSKLSREAQAVALVCAAHEMMHRDAEDAAAQATEGMYSGGDEHLLGDPPDEG